LIFFFENSSYLFIHLNISLQTHFDELDKFLQKFSKKKSNLHYTRSETRININPSINVDIPGYEFVHFPSPTKAGGVGAYNSNNL